MSLEAFMKGRTKILTITFIILFSIQFFAQDKNSNKDKSVYTLEEGKNLCGIPVDSLVMKKVYAKQDSMYKAYRSKKKLSKIATIPNWQGMMSPVEDQNTDRCTVDCWAHSATGVTEGQLHIALGSNIGIDLDETDIVYNGVGYCNDDFPSTALYYISTSKAKSEVSSYPNLPGVRWDIIQYNYISGINDIKAALENGPVTACFYRYADFWHFFDNDPTAVYTHSGGGNYDGHAVVIVSYNDDEEYWLCKNSWGSGWGDNGYFRIGYAQCGIETWENFSVTVNQSCFAKIVPNIFSTMAIAFNYNFVNNEYACFVSFYTLPDNVTVPVNKRLLLYNGETLDLNSRTIVSIGGTITKESGATINGLAATNILNYGGSGIKGLFSNVGTAATYAADYTTILIASGTFCDDIVLNGKTSVNITGAGVNSTYINGQIYIYNCTYPFLEFFESDGIYLNNCYDPIVYFVKLVGDCFTASYCSVVDLTIKNYSGEEFSLGSGTIGTIYYPSEFRNMYFGMYVFSNTLIGIEESIFCGNNWDIYVGGSGSWVNAASCAFSRDPSLSTYGNVNYLPPSNYTICLSKTSNIAGNDPKPLIKSDTTFVAFRPLSDSYLDLSKRVKTDLECNGKFDKAKFSSDYLSAANNFNSFINKYPNSSYSKTALIASVNCFKKLDDYEQMRRYLQEVIANKSLASLKGLANRLMIDYYNNLKDFNKALSTADEILKSEKNDVGLICDVLYAKGLLLDYSLNKNQEAIDSYTSIIKNYPDNAYGKLAKQQLKKLGISIEKPKEVITEEKVTTLTSSNYPNPFNPTTKISFSIPQKSNVKLVVFDVLGREVSVLANRVYETGKYEVTFDASSLPSGVYFYNLTTAQETISKKMLLVK